jgi:signal transduction histidine kinase
MLKKTFLIISLLLSGFSNAQINADDIRMAYLLKIAGDFNWEVSTKPLKIGVFINNREFFYKLQEYTLNKEIGGRRIKLSMATSPKKINQYDIVYFGKEKNKVLKENIHLLDNQKTLVFTDLAPNMEHTMVNLYTSFDHKLKFKINSNLLRSHKFDPSSLMLILGGSDEDIFSFFEEKDSSITFERNRALDLHKRNQSQEHMLFQLENKMQTIKGSLKNKTEEVLKKSTEIKNINGKLELQKDYLKKISSKILTTSTDLKKKESQIEIQEQKLENQISLFKIQNFEINTQEKKIKNQNEIIDQRGNLLELTKTYLNYAYLFSFILLSILIFAIISFLGKRKSNKKIGLQNQKLQQTLEALKTTQAKLIQNEKMASLGMVTAGMAHEINNPMTFIFTGVTILKDELKNYEKIISQLINGVKNASDLDSYKESSESTYQTVLDIEFGAKRVTEIVQSLQNFSRLNENDLKIIPLAESIKSTLTILGSHAREKNVTIEVQPSKPPILIQCFPALINQVFVNLLANSIDAVKPNIGLIKIKTKKINNKCFIEIIDNGAGISEENLGKVFDPFFTTKEIGQGTGLGLSISYNIIKKHSGNFSVTSVKNKETCFMIELPLKFLKENSDES